MRELTRPEGAAGSVVTSLRERLDDGLARLLPPERCPEDVIEAVLGRRSRAGAGAGRRQPVRACPVSGGPASPQPADTAARPCTDVAAAEEFVRLHHAEALADRPPAERLRAVRAQIEETGTYVHTESELTFGARVAWRNAARCIGRLYWQSLRIRDRRQVTEPSDVAAECFDHLRAAFRGGAVRSTMTVFAPDTPDSRGPRIVNDQLVRYAGHPGPHDTVVGDPMSAGNTRRAVELGWRPPPAPGAFDVLPLMVTDPEGRTEVHEVPPDAVAEVEIGHPEHEWMHDLGLRWYTVPAISNMPLEIGGVRYGAAPFNGWYLATEIGARNLADADRYDLLPAVARGLGLDTTSDRTLWKDRALVELVRAVQWSFDRAGVTVADHHGESRRFLQHVRREERAGRSCPVDWSWIVPPMSGATTPVFHRYYDDPDTATGPAFLPPEGGAS